MKNQNFKLKLEETNSKYVLTSKCKKCNLISLGEELDIDFPPNAKVTSLVKLIKQSEDFDKEFVKCRLEIIQEERSIEAAKEAKRSEIEDEARRIEIKEKQKENLNCDG